MAGPGWPFAPRPASPCSRPLAHSLTLPPPAVRAQDKEGAYLNNHLSFTILYHKDAETDLARIVGFEVEPYSVAHKYTGGCADMG